MPTPDQTTVGDEWAFYDPDMQVEVCAAGESDTPPIEVILPSMIFITAEQAERFGNALILAAKCVKEQRP